MPSPSRIQDKLFYGWVVVAALLVIATFTYGLDNSFGVFLKSIESEFGLSRAVTSSVFSIHMILGIIFSLLGGWALDRYGPKITIFVMGLFTGLSLLLTSQTNASWQIFITFGLLLSIGTGPAYIVIMATVSRWFDKKRGLALGIAGSGAGLAAVFIVPFATYLISSFNWRIAYIVMGLITWLIVIPLSRLVKKNPHEIGVLPDGVKLGVDKIETGRTEIDGKQSNTQPTDSSLLQAARTRNFWFLAIIWLLYSFCLFLVFTHIVPHATDIGISAMKAATILSLIGGGNIAGRLLIGKVSDNIGRKSTAITCALLVAGAMIWLIWSQDLWMLYLFAIVFGFFFGGLDPIITALIGDTFGLRSIGVIMATLNVAFGIGAAGGPFAGGLIFDVSGSYSTAFLAGALAMLTVALFTALLKQETIRNV